MEKRIAQEEINKKLMEKGKKIMDSTGKNKQKFVAIPRQASKNVKKAEVNLAAVGAAKDKKGVKYSSSKGTKTFIQNRKKSIRKLNKDLGYSESDEEGEAVTAHSMIQS